MKLFKQLVLAFVLILGLSACTSSQVSDDAPSLKAFLKNSSKPAVLKFYADWCVTCKAYAPDFARVESELSQDVDFFSINIDNPESKALVKEFKIAHIPVTIFVNKDRTDITKQFAPISYANLKKKVRDLEAK